jgi:membrane-bound lytic murein transglycosylase D
LILLASVDTVGEVSRGRMQTSKFITGVWTVLAASLMLIAAGPIYAFADESFGGTTPGLLDPPVPSLTRQSSGFELETPAEAGAVPISRSFVLRAPKPVAPFPIQMSRYVRRYLSDYLTAPGALQDTFDRNQPYMPDMVRVLRSYGLPDDLIYLAFAESEFTRTGRGPWQLNVDTARRFGLHVDSYVDERRDPVLSTKAAAEYLATLHDAAGEDWPVTVVGWNNGDHSIDRYWSLRGPNFEKFGNRLPRRTKMLLGRFMAVTYIARHAQSYGITAIKLDVPPPYQMLRVRGGTALSRVALDHGTTLTRLHELNPGLLRDIIPSYGRSYDVRVPIEQRASLNKNPRF